MARPLHTDPGTFTGGEVTLGTGISTRNLQFLRDRRLGPFAHRDMAGGLYGEDTLAELAMISATAGAGFELSLSAACVDAALDHAGRHDAARLSVLHNLYDEQPETRADRYRPSIAKEGESWFHRHALLRARDPERRMRLDAGSAHDAILVIADRQHVGLGTKGKPRLPALVGGGVDPLGPLPVGRMDGLVRGGTPTFRPIHELVDTADAGAVAGFEASFQSAVRDALAIASINLSLAIRRTFDAIYNARKAKGGPMWDLEVAT